MQHKPHMTIPQEQYIPFSSPLADRAPRMIAEELVTRVVQMTAVRLKVVLSHEWRHSFPWWNDRGWRVHLVDRMPGQPYAGQFRITTWRQVGITTWVLDERLDEGDVVAGIKVGLASGWAGVEEKWLVEERGTGIVDPVGGICFVECTVILETS